MVENKCSNCEGCTHKEECALLQAGGNATVCHQGFPEDKCPKIQLENEKLLYGALLIIAVILLVVSNCC